MLREADFEYSAGRVETASVSVKPRMLMLTHRVPYPPDKGDRIRTYHILKHLSQRATIHLACLADEPPHPETQEVLSRFCERVEVVHLSSKWRWARVAGSLAKGQTASEGAFWTSRLKQVLAAWGRQNRYDATLISASSLVPYVRIPGLRDVPTVVDLVDVDSQKWFDYAQATRGPKRWLYTLEGHRVRRVERDVANWARAVTLVSEAEAELYRRKVRSDGPIHAITNGVDLDHFRPMPPPSGREHGCVFVGAMDYRPNVDGVCWFAKEIWPALRQRYPEQRFRIVGRNPAKEVRSLERVAGVEVIGTVPDVRPYFADAAIVVAPLRIARGVQNKVLEAMAMGKVVVASSEACAGLRCRSDADILTAGDPRSWIEVVTRCLESQELRHVVGAAGRRYVEQFHSWKRSLDFCRVAQLFD